MRVMVLGASGQLGRHVCAQLGENAIPVVRDTLDLASPTLRKDAAVLLQTHAPDIVFNAAAYTNVAGAEDNEDAAMQCNATAPAILAELAAEAGVGFLHGSTDYVFDGTKRQPYTEADATRPLNAYGRSKLAGEKAVLAMHPGAIVARYSWLYDSAGSGFFATIRKLASQQDSLRIVADQIGTPTYAADAARMSIALLKAKPPSGIYHVASCGYTSWHGFACHAIDDDTRVEPILACEYKASVARPADSRLATERLARLGIAIPHWRDGVARCKESVHGN